MISKYQCAAFATIITVLNAEIWQWSISIHSIFQRTKQSNAVFSSEIQYVVPSAPDVAEGAESVLSKAMLPSETAKRKRKHEDDEEDLGKNFKF